MLEETWIKVVENPTSSALGSLPGVRAHMVADPGADNSMTKRSRRYEQLSLPEEPAFSERKKYEQRTLSSSYSRRGQMRIVTRAAIQHRPQQSLRRRSSSAGV